MKTKKRSMSLILAACCLSVVAALFSNPNPLKPIFADNESYNMVFDSNNNKFHNHQDGTCYSGEQNVYTNFNNQINFEYKNIEGLNDGWHTVKPGGYFTNLEPINGLETIDILFANNDGKLKIYYSLSSTFDEEHVMGDSTSSYSHSYSFGYQSPAYFKLVNTGENDLIITSMKLTYSCIIFTSNISVTSSDDNLGTVIGGGNYSYGEVVSLTAIPNSGAEFIGWYTDNGQASISKDNPYTLKAEYMQDVNFIGAFTDNKKYEIEVDYDSACGDVLDVGSYVSGVPCSLQAIAKEGYVFDYWCDENSNIISYEATYRFIMPSHNVYLRACFAEGVFLEIINDYTDFVNVNGGGYYKKGTRVELTASYEKGSIGWYWDGRYLFRESLFLLLNKDTTVEIRWSATSIDNNGIVTGCTNDQKDIAILDGATSIDEYAFSDNVSINSILIPSSIKTIKRYAFKNCSSLTNVYYAGTIENWCKITFTTKDSNPMYHAEHFYLLNEYNEWYEATEIKISDTVTKIGNYQFYGFEKITSIIIPETVTSIGSQAFSECTSLTSIVIPDSVTSINYKTFDSCTSLISVTFGDNIKTLGQDVFINCSSLTNVYYAGTIESWCNYDFSSFLQSNPMVYAKHFYMLNESNEWNEIKEIIIPDTVTKIGFYQFVGFECVTSVIIPNSVEFIGKQAFAFCSSLTSVEIGNNVSTIREEAFYGCSSLTSVIIPDSVIYLGAHAFIGCSSLASVEIGNNVSAIREETFFACSSLTSVIIPDSVSSLGYYAFAYCGLTSIVIPIGVSSISFYVFAGCSSLKNVTYEGTVDEWNNIDLDDDWNSLSKLETITCTDSVIVL